MAQLTTKHPFIKCMSGDGARVGRQLFIQFNRQWDRDHDVWYQEGIDFKAPEWKSNIAINSDEVNMSGTKRMGAKATSFTEVLELGMVDDQASPLLQEIQSCIDNGDNYMFDMIDGGINVKIVKQFGNGIASTKTFYCNTLTGDLQSLDKALELEGECALEVTFNREPIIVNSGFDGKTPEGITDVSVTTTVEIKPDTRALEINVSNIQDVDNLIVTPTKLDEKFLLGLYQKIKGQYSLIQTETYSGTGIMMNQFKDLEDGDYLLTVEYCVHEEKNGTLQYRVCDSKQITMIGSLPEEDASGEPEE